MPAHKRQPTHWQDAVGWGLALWLMLSPWILEFASESIAVRVTVAVAFALLFVEVMALTSFHAWEEWINAALGLFLLAAPFVFKFLTKAATVNALLAGGVIVALAVTELRQERA